MPWREGGYFSEEKQKKSTFGILDYSGPKPWEPGDYVSIRKPAFYMVKSYRRAGS